MEETECHVCGNSFTYLGNHWKGENKCSYPNLTDRQYQITTGLLLGDANCSRSGTNPHIDVKNTNRKFLEWVNEEYGIISNGISLSRTAEDSARSLQNTISPNTVAEGCNDVYRLTTRSHPEFEEFREWYETGEKRFPEDLILTPLIVKVWYVCDGSLWMNEGCTGRVSISSVNESDRCEFLIQLFENKGFSPTYTGDHIFFGTDESFDILHWMGEPIPGFEYKWAIEDFEGYQREYSER